MIFHELAQSKHEALTLSVPLVGVKKATLVDIAIPSRARHINNLTTLATLPRPLFFPSFPLS